MVAKQLEALFGAVSNVPSDSATGAALKDFVDTLRADFKAGGGVGLKLHAMLTAATQRSDTAFKALGVLERESVVQLAGLGLTWLEN